MLLYYSLPLTAGPLHWGGGGEEKALQALFSLVMFSGRMNLTDKAGEINGGRPSVASCRCVMHETEMVRCDLSGGLRISPD